MGNNIGRRPVVEEKYTKPQGVVDTKGLDYKKLRKLILNSKLAPCYPGQDERDDQDLEECPICFLYYPSLNRSKCCRKAICTECFIQIKPPCKSCPLQCPFCKSTCYDIEYVGAKTKKEKEIEEIEEQRVIEAQISMRQKQIQVELERMKKKQEMDLQSIVIAYPDRQDIFPANAEDMTTTDEIWLAHQDYESEALCQRLAVNSGGASGSAAEPSSAILSEEYLARGEIISKSFNAQSSDQGSVEADSVVSEDISMATEFIGGRLEEHMMLTMAISLANAPMWMNLLG